jgi:murein peptide amidase A
MRRPPPVVLLVFLALAGAIAVAVTADDGRAAHTALPVRRVFLGHSVQGRPIRALVLGDPAAPVSALVVGNVHGDEPGGFVVVSLLRRWRPPAGVALWLVRSFNPDGTAARTRQNAHGVDLNRNFPFHWRPLGPPGSRYYAGPRPLSEPESRIEHSLILRIRPRLSIWFHQPYDVTDQSGGDVRLERRFARLSGLPLRRLPRYPGSITSWQDFRLRTGTAFVAELPAGPPSRAAASRYARAVETVITEAAVG